MTDVVKERLRRAYLDAALAEIIAGPVPPDVSGRVFAANPGEPIRSAPSAPRASRRGRSAALIAAGILVVALTLYASRLTPSGRNPAQDPKGAEHSVAGSAFLPLRIGSRWRYEVLDAGSSGPRTVVQTVTADLRIAQREISQLRIDDVDTVQFAYAAADERGIYRVEPWLFGTSPGFDIDAVPVRIVAAPVGAVPTWAWSQKVPSHRPRRLYGGSSTGRLAQCKAELLGMGEAVTVPAGKFSCLHVRIAFEDAEGEQWHEDLWYARGVGIVQRDVEQGGRRIAQQRLRSFVPAPNGPDRASVLATFLDNDGLAAQLGQPGEVEWVELGNEARILRSQFAIVAYDQQRLVVRILADEANWFEPASLAAHNRMVEAEQLDALSGEMFSQSLAASLSLLTARLTAATREQRGLHGPIKKTSTALGNGARETDALYSAKRADGKRVILRAVVRVLAGRVVRVEVE